MKQFMLWKCVGLGETAVLLCIRTAKQRAVSHRKRLSLHTASNPAYSAAKTASTASSVL